MLRPSLVTASAALALSGAVALLAGAGGPAAAAAIKAPPPALMAPASDRRETAVFAGGCFWGVEGVFEHVRGVARVTSGYAGGSSATANYEQVGSGRTGHAEAVRIDYDPAQVNYAELLRIFFSVAHDPTELDRQGPDVGRQYRSAIFPLNPTQAKVASAYIAQLSRARLFDRPIVTRLEPFKGFYSAEGYHQDFMARNPRHPYIVAHDRPKVRALKALFPEAWRG